MNASFTTFHGINALVFEDDHNYLKDLHTQQKRKYFPNMSESSNEFGNLVFPATSYTLKN